jgi:hypothetical protein
MVTPAAVHAALFRNARLDLDKSFMVVWGLVLPIARNLVATPHETAASVTPLEARPYT